MSDRFEFEHAERILDEFVYNCRAPDNFLRVYAKLKLVLAVISITDYAQEGDAALACAWEELDVAVRGYGDELLTGIIIQLWRYLPSDRHREFRSALKRAFAAASAATSTTVFRLHEEKYRLAEVNDPSKGWGFPTAVPLRGPRLQDWAKVAGYPPEQLEAAFALLYAEKRLIDEAPMPPKGNHLRLLE